MKTIVFKRVARELLKAKRTGLLKVPLEMMAARVQELIKVAASLGFGFAGPVNSTLMAPYLMAYSWYKVPFHDHTYEGRLTCWQDGAVALDMAVGKTIVFGLRIDKDGKISQQGGQANPIRPEGNCTELGELLGRVEKAVAVKYPTNIPDDINELYILTKAGRLICRAGKDNKRGPSEGTTVTQSIITALKLAGKLCGYVHVCTSYLLAGKEDTQPQRRETLVFSAFGHKTKRVRVYELKRFGTQRRPVRLVAAFDGPKTGDMR